MLGDYSSNTELTTHVVAKMLYRISIQLKMTPLLFHISIFRTLQQILTEPQTPRMKVLIKHAWVGGGEHPTPPRWYYVQENLYPRFDSNHTRN